MCRKRSAPPPSITLRSHWHTHSHASGSLPPLLRLTVRQGAKNHEGVQFPSPVSVAIMNRRSVPMLVLLFAVAGVCVCQAFVRTTPSALRQARTPESATQLFETDRTNDASDVPNRPVLVIGATGKVGRLVVKDLLARERSVIALVRDKEKATELFGDESDGPPSLEYLVVDLSMYEEQTEVLESAIRRCDSIISVSGTFRFSKPTDFLPWRLFRADVSTWADRSHPYYGNYMAQRRIIDLAEKHEIRRFVRLTGLTTGYSAYSPVTVLFSMLLSMSSRYHGMCEQYLRNSSIPYVILRPGGLADDDRNEETTWLQADPSGICPPPGRVPRSDVAALAVEACVSGSLSSDQSTTLGIRAVGDTQPKPQGKKDDGLPTASACIQSIASMPATLLQTTEAGLAEAGSKPLGVSVAVVVYSLFALSLKLVLAILSLIRQLIL